MPQPSSLDAERLMAEVAWVRRLAARLAGDGHQADDLVQDTMAVAVAALRRDGVRPASTRAWLTGVLRNVFRQNARRDRHRAERELEVSRAERTPSTADLVERASMQRQLVGVLLELDEPYRSTLLLKFFEELPHDEIARRTNVSVSAVSTRVSRGLERMRTRLERRMGSAWIVALAPLREWPAATTTATTLTGMKTAAVVMSTPIKVLLSAGALTGAIFVVRSMGTRADAGAIAPIEVSDPVDEFGAAPVASTSALEGVRAPVADTATVATKARVAPVMPATSARVALRGRVIDLEGNGVVGVEVHAMGVSPHSVESDAQAGASLVSTRTGARGAFELDAPRGAQRVRVVSKRYATLLSASIPSPHPSSTQVSSAQDELVVVVTWRVPFAGRVIDEAGQPIAGATIEVYQYESSLKDLGIPLDRTIAHTMRARSQDDGAFAVADAADLPDATLVAFAPGYERYVGAFPAGGDAFVELTLSEFHPDPDRLVGEVLLPNGLPAAGAYVSAGVIAVLTDAAGKFALRPEKFPGADVDDSRALTVRAALPGFAAAERALAPRAEEPWPERITLELASADQLVLAGIVVDHAGAPLANATLSLLDQTPFGQVPADSSLSMYIQRSLEQVLSGTSFVDTDAEGRFRIDGVLDRPYRLRVVAAASLQAVTAGPFQPGGEAARIVIDTREVGTIEGRLVDANGDPVPGVRVTVSRGHAGYGFQFGGSDTTNERGAFRIEGTATGGVTLSLSGDSIVPEIERALPEDADLEDLELVVGLRCHVQFEWADYDEGVTEVRTLDADGEPLDMIHMRGNAWGPQPTATVFGERSDVLVASDRARWFQVLVNGEEVDRIAFRPMPGEVQRVQL